VLSSKDLALTGLGIVLVKNPAKVEFPYRYSGLRLLIFRDKRWFLLPAQWRSGAVASAIILTDSDQIRVELSPG
jgi:hypothetical protein